MQLALRERAELLGGLRPCFARVEPWLQAGKYLRAVMSELPELNGWSIARHAGDRTPDKTQRLLNHAAWDTFAAMGVVRRYAVAGLEEAARRGGRRRGHLVIGAIDETGQEKQGNSTAGVKRQYLGCAGKVANGISTVHLSYVRERTGHALAGARQRIPREHLEDPVKSQAMGLPPGLRFRTKGQLAIDICGEAYGGGLGFDFICGEVYGGCTEARLQWPRGPRYAPMPWLPAPRAGWPRCDEAVVVAGRQGDPGPDLVRPHLDLSMTGLCPGGQRGLARGLGRLPVA